MGKCVPRAVDHQHTTDNTVQPEMRCGTNALNEVTLKQCVGHQYRLEKFTTKPQTKSVITGKLFSEPLEHKTDKVMNETVHFRSEESV